jgi:hypothetical protein
LNVRQPFYTDTNVQTTKRHTFINYSTWIKI